MDVALSQPRPQAAKTPWPKRAKRAARYALVRVALALVAALPLRVAGWLGEQLGRLAFVLASKQRRWALEGLQRAYPEWSDAQRSALALRTFRHLGRSALELCCVRQMDRALDEWVEFPEADRAALRRALEKKKGVLFISGHVGHWELLGRRLGLTGFPTHTIAKEPPDARLGQLIARFREEGRIHVILRGRDGAAKQMLRVLRDGEILGLFIDQDTKVQSVFVPFFGHPASTPRAAADLALRSGAAVVVGFCQRQPNGRYRLSVAEVEPPLSERSEAAAVALTAKLTQHIEAAIRQAPEQWVWMHRRWKTAP